MKHFILFVIALFLSVNISFAASWNGTSGSMEFKDIKRLEDVISKNRYIIARITKYQKLKDDEFMVRIEGRDEVGNLDKCSGDYIVKYFHDILNPDLFKGKFYYWFGLFDTNKNVCGYASCLRLFNPELGQKFDYNDTAVDINIYENDILG